MSDVENYTIEEVDEAPGAAPVDADPDDGLPVVGAPDGRAIGVLVTGVLTIAAAGWCSTINTNFNGGDTPRKLWYFVAALNLPLSIVGALLTTIGICLLVFRVLPWRQGD